MNKNYNLLPLFKGINRQLFLNRFVSSSDNLRENVNFYLPSFAADSPKAYLNVLLQRSEMVKDLKGKSGIYCWINKVNGKYYIGSGAFLNNRINDYFQESYYRDKANLIIVKAILKYGLGSFALIILEFSTNRQTKTNELLSREQYYLDKLNPEYNTLSKAGSSQGYKHTPESINKIIKAALGRKHSEEVRKAMSSSRMGENNNMFGKSISEATRAKISDSAKNRIKPSRPSLVVEVLDLESNSTTEYISVREAAKG